jgi:membrane-associated protease RseP (regulator of RpoE activity)
MTYVVGILAAILSFGFIVFIHELGHFLTARWAGIRCPQFAIGFGPKLLSFPIGGTDFSLRLLPLGGYVLMVGEEAGAEADDSWHKQFTACVGEVNFPTTAGSVLQNISQPDDEVLAFLRSLPPHRVYHRLDDLEGSFYAKSTWQKTVTILGGVCMNFLCATLLLLGLGFTVGLGNVQKERLARASQVGPGTPAEKAGLKPGDDMIKVDGISVVSGPDFIEQMSGKVGMTVTVTVQNRKKQSRELKITPDLFMDEAYTFRQGIKVELVKVQEDVQIPQGLQLPFVVDEVNGKALQDLQELRAWGRNSKELTLSGPQGQWPLKAEKNFRPRAVMGVILAEIIAFGFEKKATADVLQVLPGSQAARAGVLAGDKLLTLQGVEVIYGQTELEACLLDLSQRPVVPAESFKLAVIRGDQVKELIMQEIPKPTAEGWGVKLQPVDARVIVETTAFVMKEIITIPYKIGRDLYTNFTKTWRSLKEETTGPIGIMQQIYDVSDEGLPELLFLVAILNAFIATFNLLPIPALDGCRLAFIWWGALRGRAVDPEKEGRIHLIGIIVLLLVVAMVSYRDIGNLFRGNHLMK